MGDLHKMIIHHIGKIIGWISVCLDQHHIIQLFIWRCYFSIDHIIKGGLSLYRIILANHIGLTGSKSFFNFLLGKGQTVLIIFDRRLSPFLRLLVKLVKTVFRTETVICLSLFDQFFGVFQIHSCLHPLTLDIRPKTAVFIRSLIVFQPGFLHGLIYQFQCPFYKPLLIGILDPQKKISSFMLCNKVGIECCSQISDMHTPRWTRRKSGSDLFHFFLISARNYRSMALLNIIVFLGSAQAHPQHVYTS